MNTASEPYSTALLITTSISYSRYFSTAMPIATHRHKNATFDSTGTTTESVTIDGMSVATTSTAADANHFSCSRSSPAQRAPGLAGRAERVRPHADGMHKQDHAGKGERAAHKPRGRAPPPRAQPPGWEEQEHKREHRDRDHPDPVGQPGKRPPGRQRLAAWPRALRGEPDAGGQLAGRASCGRASHRRRPARTRA